MVVLHPVFECFTGLVWIEQMYELVFVDSNVGKEIGLGWFPIGKETVIQFWLAPSSDRATHNRNKCFDLTKFLKYIFFLLTSQLHVVS